MCDKGHPGTPGFGTFSIDDFLYWRGEGTHNDELEVKQHLEGQKDGN